MPDHRKQRTGRGTFFLRNIWKIFGGNIGTMIFGVLLLYIIFSLFVYMLTPHVDSYQVTAGVLSRNDTYTGFALREETLCRALSNGYVNYYVREGGKINAGGVVYGLSATQVPETQVSLSREDLANIRKDMLSFSKSFDPSHFNTSYHFKSQIEGNILQYSGVTADLSSIGSETASSAQSGSVLLGNQTLYKSEYDGIVFYTKDGYAGKKLEDLVVSDFNQNAYKQTNLKTSRMVRAGDDIYTIITDENWSLIVPLTDKQAVQLKNREMIRVKFLKDNGTQSGDFSIFQLDGRNFGKIDFDRGLIRYASDRYLDVELVTNTAVGLKIPLTAIVTKEFYTIPASFYSEDTAGFYVETKELDGSLGKKYISPTIYASISDSNTTYLPDEDKLDSSTRLYVDKSIFKQGDVIINESTQERFVVRDTDILEGVYCTNTGYTSFRRIEVLDQNEEYAIVDKSTKYGLVRYDHIVRNAHDISERDVLY